MAFDYEELENNSKDAIKQINNLLLSGKGICNSISYYYKVLLEQVDVYSLIVFCRDGNDLHTIVLVDNGDQTFSFDDVSMAIYGKEKPGDTFNLTNQFDYDPEDAIGMNQGINDVGTFSKNLKYLFFPSSGVNIFFGKSDEYYKTIMPGYLMYGERFESFKNYISSYKKQHIDTNRRQGVIN